MKTDDWILAKGSKPYGGSPPCAICGGKVDGPFYYDEIHQIAHKNCIDVLPDEVNDLQEAILSDISSSLRQLVVLVHDLVVNEGVKREINVTPSYPTRKLEEAMK